MFWDFFARLSDGADGAQVEPSTPRLAGVMAGVCGGSLLLYMTVGLTGYLMFGACVCDNISLSFGPSVPIAVGQGFVVASVCCGYATLCWPCRDALLELLYPLYLKYRRRRHRRSSDLDVPAKRGDSDWDAATTFAAAPPPPSLPLKRMAALLVIASAASVAWFDPPFAALLAILGAVGGGLCGFVMPALAYIQFYHAEKTWSNKIFGTCPGWCLIFSCILFCFNTGFVLQDTFAVIEDGGQDRACLAPQPGT
jgi:amino acid permease